MRDEIGSKTPAGANQAEPLQKNPQVPDHRLLRRIGQGSYGEVWLARSAVGTLRAVKVVFRSRFKDQRPYDREFSGIQKYEPVSRTNEGLVDVLQIGRNEAEGYFYYVMELADDAQPLPSVKRAAPSDMGGPEHVETYVPKTLAQELRSRGRLSVEECISLGLNLNLALGHLHRQGLIHRDVKPSNIIFVSGVAKLADIGLVAELAEAESFVGTEGFIPPEGPNSPKADIYALGKVLYEACMGKDRRDFPEPRSTLGTDADSRALMELNAVLLKACAPNPRQRYQTAEEMNADLALLHSGKSVQQKQLLERRLKMATRAGVALAAVLVLGAFPYYLAITQAIAAKAAAKNESAQRLVAVQNQKRAQVFAQFLSDTLQSAGPSVARGRDKTLMLEILDQAAHRVATQLTNEPEVEADVRVVIGKTYEDLGQYTNALAMTQEALRLRKSILGYKHPAVAEALNNIGAILSDMGHLEAAEDYDREALNLRKEIFGKESLEVALSMNNLGFRLWNRSDYAGAEAMHREALRIRLTKLHRRHPDVAKSLNNLGMALWAKGDFDAAESDFQEALEIFRETLGKTNPFVATMLNNLGTVLRDLGRMDEAEGMARLARNMRWELLGPRHALTLYSQDNLAIVLQRLGKLDEAEKLHLGALAVYPEVLGTNHQYIAESLSDLAIVLAKKGDFSAAENMQRDALATAERALGKENPDSADALDGLALLAGIRGDLLESERLLNNALAMIRHLSGGNHPDTIPPLWHLAWVQSQHGNAPGSDSLRREAIGLSLKGGNYGLRALTQSSYDLADLLQVQGRFTEAEALLLDTLECLKDRREAAPLFQRSLIQRLVQFYESWDRAVPNSGKNKQVSDWRKRLEDLQTQMHKAL